MIRRREVITLLGSAAAAWPLSAHAQQPGSMRRIGVLTGYAESDLEAQARLAIFRQRLQELGWTIGRNLRVDYRWSGGDTDQARTLAKELVELQPDVILGETTSSVRALQQTTAAIPIVFTNLSNPLGSGFIASMARPGGNITGFTNFESSMGGKWLQVLKEVVPSVSRTAIMFNPAVSTHIAKGYYLDSLEDAAKRLGVEQLATPVHKANDIEDAINTLARKSDGALIVLPDTFTLVHRDLILKLTAHNRVPAVYSFRLFAQSGGLMSYGINATDQFPRAASYVDRILKGEKPADLPVQAPTKYELVINLKTAKALGLEVPPMLLARADEVIEVNRRDFITLVGGAAAAWPLAARAQQPARMREIAIWMGRPNDAEGQRHATAFREALQALSWTVGRNIRTDYRWMTGDIDRTRLAREIVEKQPDVIVAETTVAIAALSRESRTIPMVFVNVSDPVGGGFVSNLARPGGNITGFMSNEPTLGGKWPELLKEIAPEVRHVGFLFNPETAPYAEPFLRHAENAARSLGIEVTASRARNDAEIEQAIAAIAGNPGCGLIVLPEATTNARYEVIIALAARHRVPAIYAYRYQATGGGLISYGVDIADLFRGAAAYVDRILRGEKPADLPVHAPTRFRLVVNLITAKALGLTVPTTTLLRADEVIE